MLNKYVYFSEFRRIYEREYQKSREECFEYIAHLVKEGEIKWTIGKIFSEWGWGLGWLNYQHPLLNLKLILRYR